MTDKRCVVKQDDLREYARAFAKMLTQGDIVLLVGALGAGKTSFVRETAYALDAPEIVSSPTFALLHEYAGILQGAPIVIRHLDLYRLENEDALYDIGLDELLEENDLMFVEWGDKFPQAFNPSYIEVTIEILDDETRAFSVRRVESGRA